VRKETIVNKSAHRSGDVIDGPGGVNYAAAFRFAFGDVEKRLPKLLVKVRLLAFEAVDFVPSVPP